MESFFRFLRKSIYSETELPGKDLSSPQVCQVCLFPGELLRPTQDCKHKTAVCKTNILSGGCGSYNDSIDRIRCLVDKCSATFSVRDLELYLSKVEFEKWNSLVFNSTIEKLEEFRWCTSNCGSGQLVEGGEKANTFFTCQACSSKTCLKHRVPMHSGITCKEYDEKLKKEFECQTVESENWKKSNAKPCPQCKSPIEKNDGCDHMTCIKCKYEFCWLCLEDYKKIRNISNKKHKSTCKYYG